MRLSAVVTAAISTILLVVGAGCSSGYAGRTSLLYSQVTTNQSQAALDEVVRLLDEVEAESENLLDSYFPLLLLERAGIYQSLGRHSDATTDYAEADTMLELLDLTPEGAEGVAQYLFSDDVGLYRPPLYEKLMINMMAMSSYLASGDYRGAQVEARRLTVLLGYFATTEVADHPILGAANYLAGLAMEASGETDSALRYYISAWSYGQAPGLAEALVRLGATSRFSTRDEIREAREALGLAEDASLPPTAGPEIVTIVLSGLPPRREAERYPIGIVLGWVTGPYAFSPVMSANVAYITAENLLTWINFPVLEVLDHSFNRFDVQVSNGDRRAVPLLTDVESFALAQWEEDRGAVAFAAVTRAVTRVLAREAVQAAGRAVSGNNAAGNVAGLLLQAGLQAADTPDTRTWRLMPAFIHIARLPTEPGPQVVRVTASGPRGSRTVEVPMDVPDHGIAVATVRFLE